MFCYDSIIDSTVPLFRSSTLEIRGEREQRAALSINRPPLALFVRLCSGTIYEPWCAPHISIPIPSM